MKKILELGPGKSPSVRGETVYYVDRQADLNLDNLRIWDLNNTPLPFESNSFDEVVANNVIEHVAHFYPLLDDIYRIIKPNGVFKILVPHRQLEWRYGPWPDHLHEYEERSFDILASEKPWKIKSLKVRRMMDIVEITKPGRWIKNVKLRRLAWCILNWNKFASKVDIAVELVPIK